MKTTLLRESIFTPAQAREIQMKLHIDRVRSERYHEQLGRVTMFDTAAGIRLHVAPCRFVDWESDGLLERRREYKAS